MNTALPHNPLRGMGSFVPRGPFYPQLQGLIFHKNLFIDGWAHLYCTDSVGLVCSCNKLASDRREPLEVPAKVRRQNILHRHNCCDVPLAEVSHSCVVNCCVGIMCSIHSCCFTNCIACLNNVLLLVTSPVC